VSLFADFATHYGGAFYKNSIFYPAKHY